MSQVHGQSQKVKVKNFQGQGQGQSQKVEGQRSNSLFVLLWRHKGSRIRVTYYYYSTPIRST